MMKRFFYTLNIVLVSVVSLFSQAETTTSTETPKRGDFEWAYDNLGLILAAMITVLAIVFLIKVLNMMMEMQRINFIKEHGIEAAKEANLLQQESWWSSFYKKMTKAIPISKEAEVDLGHDYDGIRELDNSLPPWWLYLFYATIIYAGIYMYWYHWSDNGMNQIQEYELAMDEGNKVKAAYLSKQADAINETNVTALTDATNLNDGKAIFKTYCAACHLESGAGTVGPNLTDDYWIHGGGIKNVFKTVKYGVPDKGMISWKEQLKPSEMHKVSSYILTLRGTNPPNGKAPQGDLYSEEISGTKEDTTKTQ